MKTLPLVAGLICCVSCASMKVNPQASLNEGARKIAFADSPGQAETIAIPENPWMPIWAKCTSSSLNRSIIVFGRGAEGPYSKSFLLISRKNTDHMTLVGEVDIKSKDWSDLSFVLNFDGTISRMRVDLLNGAGLLTQGKKEYSFDCINVK